MPRTPSIDSEPDLTAIYPRETRAVYRRFGGETNDAAREADDRTQARAMRSEIAATSDLTKWAQAQLEGRLRDYQRRYDGECGPYALEAIKRQLNRTKAELERRKRAANKQAIIIPAKNISSGSRRAEEVSTNVHECPALSPHDEQWISNLPHGDQ